MLSKLILNCNTINLLVTTNYSNIVQRRFRRRTMTSPPFILPKYEKIYSGLNENDR